jgi:hypothetical protein
LGSPQMQLSPDRAGRSARERSEAARLVYDRHPNDRRRNPDRRKPPEVPPLCGGAMSPVFHGSAAQPPARSAAHAHAGAARDSVQVRSLLPRAPAQDRHDAPPRELNAQPQRSAGLYAPQRSAGLYAPRPATARYADQLSRREDQPQWRPAQASGREAKPPAPPRAGRFLRGQSAELAGRPHRPHDLPS